jgi:hypothetical protein
MKMHPDLVCDFGTFDACIGTTAGRTQHVPGPVQSQPYGLDTYFEMGGQQVPGAPDLGQSQPFGLGQYVGTSTEHGFRVPTLAQSQQFEIEQFEGSENFANMDLGEFNQF